MPPAPNVEASPASEWVVGGPRIVSLLPSITEIVCEVGEGDRIVACTHECDAPSSIVVRIEDGSLPVVTRSHIDPTASQGEIDKAVRESLVSKASLYALREDVLAGIDPPPTHVLTQALCDVCAVAYDQVKSKCARLLAPGLDEKQGYRLLSVEPETLDDVRESIGIVGREIGAKDSAITDALDRFDSERRRIKAATDEKLGGAPGPRVAMLEWLDPLFFGGHWVCEMVEGAGGSYGLCSPGKRSEVMTADRLVEYDPDVIVVAPCGFGVKRAAEDTRAIMGKAAWWRELRAVREGRVFAADGNQFFSRPSPRLVGGMAILADIMHGIPCEHKDAFMRVDM